MADASAITYDALRLAAEHILGEIRWGRKLGAETSSSSTSASS